LYEEVDAINAMQVKDDVLQGDAMKFLRRLFADQPNRPTPSSASHSGYGEMSDSPAA
jgi:hypothetical protein